MYGRRFAGHSFRILLAPLVIATVLAGVAPVAASSSACVSWTGLQPPNPGSAGNYLSGVAVVSRCDAWAVGAYSNGTTNQTLIVHWNGAGWQQQPSPNPGSVFNTFLAVAATSAASAWAVGYDDNGPGTEYKTLIARWNGTSWKRVPSPNPGGPGYHVSVLESVAAISAKNAWAVGYDSAGPLILHWNGTAWKQVPCRGVSGVLYGVAAASAANIWAVGASGGYPQSQTVIVHWNGTAWKRQSSPSPNSSSLSGVAVTSGTNAWAVGSDCTFCGSDTQAIVPLIEHWNGTAWHQQPSPNLGGNHDLFGVAATSATNAWAVGDLIEHWNGTAWKQVPSPGGTYTGAAATSATNVWAVGSTSTQTLAIHCC